MTPSSEVDDLLGEVRKWRLRAWASFAATVCAILLFLIAVWSDVENDAVTACGMACGSGRMKSSHRTACECADPQAVKP